HPALPPSPTRRSSDLSGEFEGIGAEMASVDAAEKPCTPLGPACRLEVVRIIRDSPAQQAGLLAGDVISDVDGGSVAGMSIDDVRSEEHTAELPPLTNL